MKNLCGSYLRSLLVVLFAATVLCSSLAYAKKDIIFDPTAAYSATRVISTSEGEMTMRVFHTEKKERIEMEQQGQKFTMITRLDKKVSWILMPDQKMYMETSLEAAMDRSEKMGFNQEEQLKLDEDAFKNFEKLGRETVNGFETTKYKGIIQDEEGPSGEAYYWVTDSGIPVKMDYESWDDKGKKERFVMELRELKVGQQPDHLFEPPADYEVMSLGFGKGGLGGMFRNAKPNTGQVGKPAEQEDSSGIVTEVTKEAGDEAKRSVTDEIKGSVRDAVRGFFRR